MNCRASRSVFSHYFTTHLKSQLHSCEEMNEENNYKFVQFIIISICLNFITYIIHSTRTLLLVETHVCSLFYLYEHKYVELSSAHRKKIKLLEKKKIICLFSSYKAHCVQWTYTAHKSQTMDSHALEHTHTQYTHNRHKIANNLHNFVHSF